MHNGMPSMLAVCTDLQKKLIEMIASWDEKEDRNCDDLDAALVYLFYREHNLFDPPDCPSFIELSYKRLIQLKDSLTYFLSIAEDMGLDLQVRKAIGRVNEAISSSAPRSIQRKIRWKSCLHYLGNSCVILLFSWLIFSFRTAVLLACMGPYVFFHSLRVK
jgi:hypothetical protein